MVRVEQHGCGLGHAEPVERVEQPAHLEVEE
jgi:hypothetical protein